MSRTRLIYGIGISDADYTVKKITNNKEISCPYYRTWKAMMRRCYSDKFHQMCPTYIGCSVHEEWLSFMAFRAWMIKQDWKGKQLDKDITKPGNKIYSPSFCVFVTQDINKLLTDSAAIRGKYPQGVYFNKFANKFQAYIKINGIKKSLGYFSGPGKAAKAYVNAKYSHIIEIAKEQLDPRIKSGLILHANKLKLGIK